MKKLLHALLFPHIAILLILLPVATVFLVYSMVFLGETAVASIVSYVLAAYTLTVWCLRVPQIVRFAKRLRRDNRFVYRYFEDRRLRVRISLYSSLLWNTAYAVFQLGLGFYHASFWFFGIAGYYILLAIMRFFLARHASRRAAGERMREELVRYRACGILLLVMNLTLALMTFFMVYWDRTFYHHEVTAIAMAAYTFTSFTLAIINLVKYRKFGSPVYSASKAISLAAACVSMLTLSATMLTAFGDGTMSLFARRLLLGSCGGAVFVCIIVMAVHMIVRGTRLLRSERK